jgi:hypothetical protein
MPSSQSSGLSDADLGPVKEFLEEFRDATKKERPGIVARAFAEVKKQHGGDSPLVLTKLRKVIYILYCILYLAYIHGLQQIKDWLYNNGRKGKGPKVKFGRTWTARQVLYFEKQTEITATIEGERGLQPGQTEYLGALQPVISRMFKALSAEEKEELENKAKSWNTLQAPRDLQIK